MKNHAVTKHLARRVYLSPAECARSLNVAPVTLRKWAREGMLKAVVTPGGHRRYALDELERFAAEYKMPLHRDTVKNLHILIVDDDLQVSRYLAELFARFGPSVITSLAHDGFEAGRQLHSFQPDIVILDLMMQGINGYEVCTAIKSRPETKDIRVIAMTGFYSQENIHRITAAGAEACLAKPIERHMLLEMIGLTDFSAANL